MSARERLRTGLSGVERLARGGRFRRWVQRPLFYPAALLHRAAMHRWAGHAWPITCRTFFGERINLLLPSALDIALTGGKTHDSEIRLARFLIERLQPGEQVVDVGAHYG